MVLGIGVLRGCRLRSFPRTGQRRFSTNLGADRGTWDRPPLDFDTLSETWGASCFDSTDEDKLPNAGALLR